MAVGLNSVTAKAIGRTLGYGAAGATVGVAANTIPTLIDSKKGSLTNRVDCAAEKIKNDTSATLKLAVPTAAVAGAAIAKPGLLSKVGMKAAKYLGKGAKALGKLFKNPSNALTKSISKVLTTIQKNPVKYGKIGLAAAAVFYALNTIQKHAYNEGKIEQKYNDTGAIENATKNLVLNA